MRYQYALSWKKRAAFTLIEILVVIAIIAILSSLLLVGVMSVIGKGPEVQTRNELLQLGIGLEKFKTEHGLYPPDRFIVYPNRAQYSNPASTTPQLDQVSLTYLSAIWQNIGDFGPIPWAGPGITIPASGYILEGDQCLVFFLGGPPVGGPPSQPKLLGGFSINPKDPVNAPPNPVLDRKKYYDFDAGRLVFRNSANPSTAVFPSFQDPYKKQVFAYFNAYKRENAYAPTAPGNWWSMQTPNTLGLTPYVKSAGAYYNPTTFQLVSAGQDGIFGSGGAWPAGGAIPKDVQDNMTNFHERKLGAP